MMQIDMVPTGAMTARESVPAQPPVLAALQRVITALPRGRSRIARLLAGKLRGCFVAVVPPFNLDVRLAIDPSDPFQAEIWLGAYQPHVVAFLMANVRAGSTVLCAGLHVGYIASIARRLAGPFGRVLTAEPDPIALECGRFNLRLGDPARDAPIEVLGGGLSDEDATLELHQSNVLGHSSFATSHHEATLTHAQLRRGDDWLEERGVASVDVAVLDVEGWELRALLGLRQTLARSPQLVALIELSGWALKDAGTSGPDVVAFLRSRGFDVRWASAHGHGCRYGVWGDRVEKGDEETANDVLCVGSGVRT